MHDGWKELFSHHTSTHPPVGVHLMVFCRSPRFFAIASVAFMAIAAPTLAAQAGYKLPPQEIIDILDAPQAPGVEVSADGNWLVLRHRRSMPSLADMSQPVLRIGGRRINPATNGRFNPSLTTGFSIMRSPMALKEGSRCPMRMVGAEQRFHPTARASS